MKNEDSGTPHLIPEKHIHFSNNVRHGQFCSWWRWGADCMISPCSVSFKGGDMADWCKALTLNMCFRYSYATFFWSCIVF